MSSSAPDGQATEQIGPFELTLLVLSLFALAVVATDLFVPLPREVSRILEVVDLIACGVFFLDFVIRFRAAESKRAFMKLGWIDLLASVPNIEALRLGRIVRVFRVLRLLRAVRSLRHLLDIMYHNKARGGVASVALIMFLLVVFSSIGILLCENTAAANIKSAGDAVWWSVTTVTTVGYGDHYPVTTQGRIIAIVLMFSGVGMFGALSGVIASILLGRSETDAATLVEIKAMRADFERMRTAGTERSGDKK